MPGSRIWQVFGTFTLSMVLWWGICKGGNRFNEVSMTTKDHVCTGDDVISTFETDSVIQCTLRCYTTPQCLGSFFHNGDNACVMCGNRTNLITYTGMQYYQQKGDWSNWASGGTCSHTCGGGTRVRTRTCIAPHCPVGTTNDTETCHNFPCGFPEPSCLDWANVGLNESASVDIDLDGNGTQFGTGTVYCDFDTEPGKILTVVHHDKESRTYVDGFEECASYTVNLTYTVSFEAAVAIADASTGCKQYVKYECYHAEIWNCTFWRNRNQIQSEYFTGPHPSGSMCDCGETDTCHDDYFTCNCDNNGNFWDQDDGFATNKSDLPIYSFHASDTGGWWEEAYHTIGPLICWNY